MRIYILLLFISVMDIKMNAQTNADNYQLQIRKAVDKITLDGKLDEKSWQEADLAQDFWEKDPQDGIRSEHKTEGRVTYDDQYFYVAMTVYDEDDSYVVKTLSRDESLWGNDGVAIIIDPIGERTNGFLFGVNTKGAQTDVQLGGGSGEQNYKQEWNTTWYAETHVDGDVWTVEMAIPFNSIRYSADRVHWLINFARSDVSHNKTHVWAPVPRQFWAIDLGYAATLAWDAPPPKSKSNIAIIPYVSSGANQNFEENEDAHLNLSTGLDAKIAITPSLNLDLTVNPDFSQVDVDQQVTNLTRFSIFLPERRNFFLENSDLFANFGSPLLRPFFSRRIGLNEGRPVPIYAGARLSGNVTDDLRIGLLDVHTGTTDSDLSQNYFTAAASHRVLKRSKVSGFFINRQSFDGSNTVKEDYGRNAGVDLEYQSEDGLWRAKGAYYHSFKPGISSQNSHFRGGVRYSGKVLNTALSFGHVGTNFYTDIGFVNRVNLYNAATEENIRQGFNYFFNPLDVMIVPARRDFIQSYQFGLRNFITYDPDFNYRESSHGLSTEVSFASTAMIRGQLDYDKVNLLYPFAFGDANPIPAGTYDYVTLSANFESDKRLLFNYKLGVSAGSFYNGDRKRATAELNYRQQPWGEFAISGEYNQLKFPEEYGSSEIWLVGANAQISFSRDLFWNTFVQYNTQANNFNVNSRFQWQFRPLSWIFLVYSDDYLTPDFGKKYRSITFKVNYWLNI